ncbi:MAG: hypothetical protein MZU95_09860 [Desulfomicrobium escambiense]|nr:hypothetical protein [Desulfomicrobium escambiense]
MDREDIEPVVKILPERALFDHRSQIPVRRGDDRAFVLIGVSDPRRSRSSPGAP